MVTRVSARLSLLPPPPVVSSSALVPFRSSSQRAAAARAPPEARRPVVRLSLLLQTRPPLPHETTSLPLPHEIVPPTPPSDDRIVSVRLADGSSVACEYGCLARHSSVLRMLLGRGEGGEGRKAGGLWLEAERGEVRLCEHRAEVVRGVLEWMAAPSGQPKRFAAGALLCPSGVVEVARLAHFLDCPPLLRASLLAIGGALDEENAPSCLLLARELGSYDLESRAVRLITARLEGVKACEAWNQLPLSTREALSQLRDAMAQMPMRCGATSEPRELLGMVRESLCAAARRERTQPSLAEQND